MIMLTDLIFVCLWLHVCVGIVVITGLLCFVWKKRKKKTYETFLIVDKSFY